MLSFGSARSIYSLVDLAKLNGLDPKPYQWEVLTRITVTDHTRNRIDELLPWPIVRHALDRELDQKQQTACVMTA